MAQKIPPPPQFTGEQWQSFNRWLLEVTSVLSNEGNIAASEVEGLLAAYADIIAQGADIVALQGTTGSQGADITALQASVTTLTASIATINGQITTLSARNQVFNGAGAPAAGLGVVGDWYANVGGGVGARIYIKTGGAVWTPFPF